VRTFQTRLSRFEVLVYLRDVGHDALPVGPFLVGELIRGQGRLNSHALSCSECEPEVFRLQCTKQHMDPVRLESTASNLSEAIVCWLLYLEVWTTCLVAMKGWNKQARPRPLAQVRAKNGQLTNFLKERRSYFALFEGKGVVNCSWQTSCRNFPGPGVAGCIH